MCTSTPFKVLPAPGAVIPRVCTSIAHGHVGMYCRGVAPLCSQRACNKATSCRPDTAVTPGGAFNEIRVLNGVQTSAADNMPFLDQWGTAATYNHYHAGWAWSGNTPFKYFKQASSTPVIPVALLHDRAYNSRARS